VSNHEELITRLLHQLGRTNRLLAEKSGRLWGDSANVAESTFYLTCFETFTESPPTGDPAPDDFRLEGHVEASLRDGRVVTWAFDLYRSGPDAWQVERTVLIDQQPHVQLPLLAISSSNELAETLASIVSELLDMDPAPRAAS
jgi:hypothetical protein